MRIAVGGIMHLRDTIPDWWEALRKLEHGEHEVFYYVLADSELACKLMNSLAEWNYGEEQLPETVVHVWKAVGPQYKRAPVVRVSEKRAIYGRMAELRNKLAEEVIRLNADMLLSVDTDIVVPSDLLMRLTAAGKPWVSALVRNSAVTDHCYNVFRLTRPDQPGGGLVHFKPTSIGPQGKTWPDENGCGWDPNDPQKRQDLATGAVCLYSADLLRAAKWDTDHRGVQEDIGFARNAFRAGYRAWYLPIVCRHLTVDGVADG